MSNKPTVMTSSEDTQARRAKFSEKIQNLPVLIKEWMGSEKAKCCPYTMYEVHCKTEAWLDVNWEEYKDVFENDTEIKNMINLLYIATRASKEKCRNGMRKKEQLSARKTQAYRTRPPAIRRYQPPKQPPLLVELWRIATFNLD